MERGVDVVEVEYEHGSDSVVGVDLHDAEHLGAATDAHDTFLVQFCDKKPLGVVFAQLDAFR